MPDFFNPQDIAFGRTVTEKTPIAPAAPGVSSGESTTVANAPDITAINKDKQGKV